MLSENPEVFSVWLPILAETQVLAIFPSSSLALTFHLHVMDRSRRLGGASIPGFPVSRDTSQAHGCATCIRPARGDATLKDECRVRSVQDARH